MYILQSKYEIYFEGEYKKNDDKKRHHYIFLDFFRFFRIPFFVICLNLLYRFRSNVASKPRIKKPSKGHYDDKNRDTGKYIWFIHNHFLFFIFCFE